MKSSHQFLFAVALFSTVHLCAESFSSREKFDRSAPFNATGEVMLENVNGDVEIRTWDKNEIRVEGEKLATTDENLKLIDLTIDLTPARATIKARLPKRSGGFFSNRNLRLAVRFKITIPATATLKKIEVVNSSVVIEGVRGPVHCETVNGAIKATGLGGDVRLQTVNGEIRAKFDLLGAERNLSFETVNGQIDVSLPKDAGFQLNGSVVNGSIDCDFPLELGQKKRGRNLSGKIGDGRASLEAETVNGSIHLRQR